MYIYLQGDLSIGSYSNYFNTENDDRKKQSEFNRITKDFIKYQCNLQSNAPPTTYIFPKLVSLLEHGQIPEVHM